MIKKTIVFCLIFILFFISSVSNKSLSDIKYLYFSNILKSNPKVEDVDYFKNIRNKYTEKDLYWLALNIYHESRGENNAGQIMVGIVTLTRLKSKKWGNTIKKVVTAPHQFSWYWDGKSDKPRNKKCWEIAQKNAIIAIYYFSIYDYDRIMYYHNNHVSPYWAKKFIKVKEIGNHIFYKKGV